MKWYFISKIQSSVRSAMIYCKLRQTSALLPASKIFSDWKLVNTVITGWIITILSLDHSYHSCKGVKCTYQVSASNQFTCKWDYNRNPMKRDKDQNQHIQINKRIMKAIQVAFLTEPPKDYHRFHKFIRTLPTRPVAQHWLWPFSANLSEALTAARSLRSPIK